MAEETVITEEAATPAAPEERSGSGPGFILGMVLGAAAGAAAAILFAPAAGDEIRRRISEEAAAIFKPERAGLGEGGPEGSQPETPVERTRAVLAVARSRVQEATEAGRHAAREAEEGTRSLWGTLFAPFAAYWRWAGQRESTQGKMLAYGGPVAALIVIIIIASAAGGGGGDGDGDGDGEQVAGQPTQGEQATTATAPVQPTDTVPPPATDTPAPSEPTDASAEEIDVAPLLDAYFFQPELADSIRDLLVTGRDLHGLDPDDAIEALISLVSIRAERGIGFDTLLGYLFLTSIEGTSPQDAARTLEECFPLLPQDLFFFVPLFEIAEDPAADSALQEFKALIDTTCA